MAKYRYQRRGDKPAVAGGRNSYTVFLDDVEIGYVTGSHYPFVKGLYAGRNDSGNGWWEGWVLCPVVGNYAKLTTFSSFDKRYTTRNEAADAMVDCREEQSVFVSEDREIVNREIVNGLIREAFDNGKSVDQIMQEKGMSLRELAIILGRCRFEGRREAVSA